MEIEITGLDKEIKANALLEAQREGEKLEKEFPRIRFNTCKLSFKVYNLEGKKAEYELSLHVWAKKQYIASCKNWDIHLCVKEGFDRIKREFEKELKN